MLNAAHAPIWEAVVCFVQHWYQVHPVALSKKQCTSAPIAIIVLMAMLLNPRLDGDSEGV
eukprot:COSAG04_NODE_17205_length_476_cov_0.602122_1_plen_59_part_10